MQCSCGGDTKITDSKNTTLKAVLTYYHCKSCTRVSMDTLYIRDLAVAQGVKAQAAYLELDKTTAKALYDDEMARIEAAKKEEQEKAVNQRQSDTDDHPCAIPATKELKQYETGSLF